MANYALPFPDKELGDEFGLVTEWRKKHGLGPHRGVDWSVAGNTPIPSPVTGKVALIKWSNVLGWILVLQAATGKHFIGLCHLSCATHGVNCKGPKEAGGCASPFKTLKKNDPVTAGKAVAKVGNSGSASSGPHLHATLSLTVEGVIAGKVYDLHAWLKKMIAAEAKAKPVAATTEPVKAPNCPTCGQEVKK